MTKRLICACDILGVRALDYLIIDGGTGEVFSFQEHGLMDQLRPKHRD